VQLIFKIFYNPDRPKSTITSGDVRVYSKTRLNIMIGSAWGDSWKNHVWTNERGSCAMRPRYINHLDVRNNLS